MARIKLENLVRTDKERPMKQEEVSGTYSSYKLNQERYLQIDTFGREGRKYKGKPSQVFQISRPEMIKFIIFAMKELHISFDDLIQYQLKQKMNSSSERE